MKKQIPSNDFFQLDKFMQPDDFHYPSYSWVWNDVLSEDEIKKQLDYMAKCCIKNVYAIPLSKKFRPQTMPSSLKPHYLDNDYIKMFSAAVDYADEKGISFWLYDEDGWPSASACGEVVANNPELIQKGIGKKVIQLNKNGVYINAEANFLAAFLPGNIKISLPYRASAKCSITIYYVEELSLFANPYPDIFDSRTADAFINLTHNKYLTEGGENLKNRLYIVFTDEPNIAACPWTVSLEDEFNKDFRYNIRDYIPALIEPDSMGEGGRRARINYYECLSRMLAKNFYGKIKNWCHQNDLILTGHADGDDSILTYYQNGHLLRVLREMDIPGIDVILRQIFPSESRKIMIDFNELKFKKKIAENKFFPRMASSAANQIGQRYSISESFAVYGSGLTFDQMRYIINFQAVRGINLINIMNITFSKSAEKLTGLRPNFCEELPGSTDKSVFNAYIARLCYILSLGKPDIHTALYFPIRDVWAGGENATYAAENFEALGRRLESAGINFDIIDDDIILKAPIDNKISAGFSEYTTILIPKIKYMTDEVSEKLDNFSKNNVNVVFARKDTDIFVNTAPVIRSANKSADFKAIKRILNDGVLYFIYNEGLKQQTSEIYFEEYLPIYELIN